MAQIAMLVEAQLLTEPLMLERLKSNGQTNGRVDWGLCVRLTTPPQKENSLMKPWRRKKNSVVSPVDNNKKV